VLRYKFYNQLRINISILPGIIIDKSIPIDFANQSHVLAQAFQPHPVVVFENGNYYLKLFEWGVIADYMNTDEKIRNGRAMMCNAQSEKILDRKSYWSRIRKNRCLIPVTGIYEHREIKGWKKKVPYFVKVKNEKMFFIPGLFNYSPKPNTETGELPGTFTLLTRSANSIMKMIHNNGTNKNRMPLFLPFEMAKKWVEPELSDEGIQEIISYEMSSDNLEYWPVYTIRSSKERPDSKEKYEPWDWEKLPPIEVNE
jgi:putative SOS response-associated peptidase YedK